MPSSANAIERAYSAPVSIHNSESDEDRRDIRRLSTMSRKRPSRAGTRSVSTLTEAQLERKRANDRDAQRAIRQRTKEHIDRLESRIIELTTQDVTGQRLEAALRRNQELEEENSQLRSRLNDTQSALELSGSSVNSWDQIPRIKQPVPGSRTRPGEPLHSYTGSSPSYTQPQHQLSYSQMSRWQAMTQANRSQSLSATRGHSAEPVMSWGANHTRVPSGTKRTAQTAFHEPATQPLNYMFDMGSSRHANQVRASSQPPGWYGSSTDSLPSSATVDPMPQTVDVSEFDQAIEQQQVHLVQSQHQQQHQQQQRFEDWSVADVSPHRHSQVQQMNFGPYLQH